MAIDIHPQTLQVAAVVVFYMASALTVSIYLVYYLPVSLTLSLVDGLCVRPSPKNLLSE